MRMLKVLAVLGLSLGALALIPAAADAATFTVTHTADTVDANPGDGACADASVNCTLRAAILEANALAGPDTVIINPGVYTLTITGADENNGLTGDLDVLDGITITGGGGNRDADPSQTVIQAGTTADSGIDKVFSINPYFDTPFATTIEAVTIRYGKNPSDYNGDGHGGGLDWDGAGTGSLTLYNMVITQNQTTDGDGGGLALFDADETGNTSVTIAKSVISGNTAGHGYGGGILVNYSVPLTIQNSIIQNNHAASGTSRQGHGGGIYLDANAPGVPVSITITGTTIDGNVADGRAGGVYTVAPLTVQRSTVSNNTAGEDGGGILYAYSAGTLTLENATLSGNAAGGNGGGLAQNVDGSAQIVMRNVTVTNNTAATSGGGIHLLTAGAATLHNTIVAGNHRSGTPDDIAGSVSASSTHNLIGTGGSGGLSDGTNGNLVGVADPGLGPLADNGGLTRTHALLQGSPALDAGDNNHAPDTVDQRGGGFLRVLDAGADTDSTNHVDIGAFEAHPTLEEIGDQTMLQDSSLDVLFHVGDHDLGFDWIRASSDNETLVPNTQANLSVSTGTAGHNRTLTITPASGQNGTATITVTISHTYNGTVQSMSDSFVLTVVAAPDLTIAKSHEGDFRRGQTGATYTLTVSNAGSGSTDGSTVTVTDSLPTGLTPTAASGTGWTCAITGQTVTCTRSDVLASGESYPDIALTVDVAADAPDSVINSAAVSGGGDTDGSNNTAEDPTTITPAADLAVSKSHTGNFYQGQTGATYTITVSNAAGAGETAGAVTVTDTLPDGLTATAMSGEGWTCDAGALTCTRADALAAGSSYPAIALTVDVALDAASSLTNEVTVSGGGELSGTLADNTDSDATTIDPMPDLTISKAAATSFREGQSAQYELTVTNAGHAETSGTITVTDVLPTGLSPVLGSGTDWSCAIDGQTVTCTRTVALAAGAFSTIALDVAVADDTAATLTNTAGVSGGGEVYTGNNEATLETAIAQAPDLAIDKSHSGDFTQGQSGATFTIDVSNGGDGPTDGTTVTVTDTLPADLTPTSVDGGADWTCGIDGQTVTCTSEVVKAAGGSYSTITVTVDVAERAAPSLENTAEVSGGGELDSTLADNSDTDTIAVTQLPDLVVTKSHEGNFYQGQTGATYTIVVSNSGTGVSSGTTTAWDTLPTGLTATDISGEGWTCSLADLSCNRTGDLRAGESYPAIIVTVDVAADAPASLTNRADVLGHEPFDRIGNNGAEDPTTVEPRPDLTIDKRHTGDFRQGQQGATYTIEVSNPGHAPTSGEVRVTDALPLDLTPTEMSGEGWTCDLTNLRCTRSDALAAGDSYPVITLTVNVAVTAPATVTNVAAVEGGGEVITTNNTDQDDTHVIQVADLTVQKAHDGDFRQGQSGATYTITVRNVGTGATDGSQVTVADALPEGLTATGLSGEGWTCDVGTLSCTRSDALAPGGSYPDITLTVDVAADAPQSVVNAVTVSGGGEVIPDNSSDEDPTAIVQVADLAIDKQHAGNMVLGREGIYTLTVRNVGPGPTDAPVTVTDALPAGLTALELSGEGWTCDVGTLTCTRSDALAPGAAYPDILLRVQVEEGAAEQVTNEATVSGGGEIATGNNTDADPTRIVPPTPPGPPEWIEIDPPGQATREAAITLRGEANPGAVLLVSGIEVSVGDDGRWSAEVPLQEGENVITVINGPVTASVTVIRDSTPPGLVLSAPARRTAEERVVLTASTDEEGAEVAIEGQPGTSLEVSLRMGANTFTATAVDALGNRSEASVTVIRVAPAAVEREVRPDQDTEIETGYLTIRLPAGASGEPLTLRIDLGETGEVTGKGGRRSAIVAVEAEVEATGAGGSPVRQLDQRVTLTFTYHPDAVPDPAQLRIYYYDPDQQVWVELGGEVDEEAHTITVTVDHFTRFAAMVPEESAPVLDALPETVAEDRLTITGQAAQGERVALVVNGEEQQWAIVRADGRFSLEAQLSEGRNHLYVKGTGALASREAVVTYEAEPGAGPGQPTEPPGQPGEPGQPSEPPGGGQPSGPGQPPAHGLKDVAGHWAEAAIARMVERGVVRGYEDGTFRPGNQVTRLEFAVMVARLLALEPGEEPLPFTDADRIPGWAAPQVAAAVQAGIIAGREDGSFDPQAPVTRAEVAVMLARALQYAGLDVTPGDAAFADAGAIPAWAREQVAAAVRYGLITGYEDGTFGPGRSTTRAEAVTLLSRLLDAVSQ